MNGNENRREGCVMNQGVTNWRLQLPYAGDSPEENVGNLHSVQQWANQSPFVMIFAVGSGVLDGPTFPDATSGVGGINPSASSTAFADNIQTGDGQVIILWTA